MNIKKGIEFWKVFLNDKYERSNYGDNVKFYHIEHLLDALNQPEDKIIEQKINPFMHGNCRFCKGTGIEENLDKFTIYGRALSEIMNIINYAIQHGYKET